MRRIYLFDTKVICSSAFSLNCRTVVSVNLSAGNITTTDKTIIILRDGGRSTSVFDAGDVVSNYSSNLVWYIAVVVNMSTGPCEIVGASALVATVPGRWVWERTSDIRRQAVRVADSHYTGGGRGSRRRARAKWPANNQRVVLLETTFLPWERQISSNINNAFPRWICARVCLQQSAWRRFLVTSFSSLPSTPLESLSKPICLATEVLRDSFEYIGAI